MKLSLLERCFMKSSTEAWVDKAEGDWAVAGRELCARRSPNYDAACFHAQQCAEKYLKGQLQEEGIAFPWTHDLLALLDLLLPSHPLWGAFRPALLQLKNYAVAFRYPGDAADKKEAREAVKLCQGVREAVRLGFGLPT